MKSFDSFFQQEDREKDSTNGDRPDADSDEQLDERPSDQGNSNDQGSDQGEREIRQSRSSDKLKADEQPEASDEFEQEKYEREVEEQEVEEQEEDGEELKQSTGENSNGTIQKFKFDEVEEIFVDLIERPDDKQAAD